MLGQKEHAKSMLALGKSDAHPSRQGGKKFSSRDPARNANMQSKNEWRGPKIVSDSSVQQINCYGRSATAQTQNGLHAYYSH